MQFPTVTEAPRPVCRPGHRFATLTRVAAMAVASAALGVLAQTATIYGAVGNFDVVNNTGQNACGFELQLEGVPVPPSLYSYMGTRYRQAVVDAYSSGVVSGTRVTWKSPDCSVTRTVPHAPNTAFAGTCYGIYDAGCEHFGVATSTSAVTARWLVQDPTNPAPGAYIPHDPPMAVPSVYYYVQPAAAAFAAPVVVAQFEAPQPPEVPQRFGNPTWTKVFVRQMPREVTLDELLTINPLVVPLDAAQLEFDWLLVQADPISGGAGRRNRGRHQGSSTLDPTTRAVVRRYETYAYTGAVDPVTNEALCADLLCKVAAATEVGDFISAQMTAVNVQGDFVTVAKAGTGGGNVNSADQRIACGNKCVSPYPAGAATTLTAKANSGSVFAGWTGACTGTAACSVTVNGSNTVGATFNLLPAGGGGGGGGTTSGFQFKVSTSNPGVVTSDVGGINCGTTCSATVATGTAVTLTATPPAGKTFASWSGACTGTVNTCTVTVNANLSAKANFNR